MYFNYKSTENAELLKSINFCNINRFKKSIDNVDAAHKESAVRQVIESECAIEIKKDALDVLLQKGIKFNEMNTMLALSVLNGDKDLISFCFDRTENVSVEEFALLYALQKNDCSTALKLLHLGVRISNELIEIVADDTNTHNACIEIKRLQDFNSTLTINSSEIDAGLLTLEREILLGHHLCSDLDIPL